METPIYFNDFFDNGIKEIKKKSIKHIFLIDGDNYDTQIRDLSVFYDHKATKYDFHIVLLYKYKSNALNSKFKNLNAITIVIIPKTSNTREYIFKIKNKLKPNIGNIILIHSSKTTQNKRKNKIIYKIIGNIGIRIKKYSFFSFYFINQKTPKLICGLRRDALSEYQTIKDKICDLKIWKELIIRSIHENHSTKSYFRVNSTIDEIRPYLAFLVLLHKYFDFRSTIPDEMNNFEKQYDLCVNNMMRWLSSGNFYYMTNCIKMKCDLIGPKMLETVKNIINTTPKYMCGTGMYQTKNTNDIYFYIYKKIKDSYMRMDSRSLFECIDLKNSLMKSLSVYGLVELEFSIMPLSDFLDITFSNWKIISNRLII